MQPPGQGQVKQQQIKVSASPTQVNIEPGTDDTTGAESIRLNVENQLPQGTGGSQQIIPRGDPGSGEQQQRVRQPRLNAQELQEHLWQQQEALLAQIQQQQASNREQRQDLHQVQGQQVREQQVQERQDQEQREYEQNQQQQDRQEES